MFLADAGERERYEKRESRRCDMTAALHDGGFAKESDRMGDCQVERAMLCTGCGKEPSPKRRWGRIVCDIKCCPHCARSRAARLRDKWSDAAARMPTRKGYAWAKVTLTLKRYGAAYDNANTLAADLDRITVSWRRLRARLKRRWRFIGGFSALEVAGAVHIHLLAYLPFIEQAWLSDAWLDCTGDSKYVWIRAAGPLGPAIREQAKYICKEISVPGDEGKAVLIWSAFRRRQSHRAWGTAHGLIRDIPPKPIECEWCGGTDWFPADCISYLDRSARGPPN